MAQINETQNNALKQVMIQTDIPLWKMLLQCGKKEHKLSRPEAFFDLLDRQLVADLKGGNGYLEGTIPDLVRKWRWDRETVWKFLLGLSQLGAVTISTVANRKVIRVNNITVKETPLPATDVPAEREKPSQTDNCPQDRQNAVSGKENAENEGQNVS